MGLVTCVALPGYVSTVSHIGLVGHVGVARDYPGILIGWEWSRDEGGRDVIGGWLARAGVYGESMEETATSSCYVCPRSHTHSLSPG